MNAGVDSLGLGGDPGWLAGNSFNAASDSLGFEPLLGRPVTDSSNVAFDLFKLATDCLGLKVSSGWLLGDWFKLSVSSVKPGVVLLVLVTSSSGLGTGVSALLGDPVAWSGSRGERVVGSTSFSDV